MHHSRMKSEDGFALVLVLLALLVVSGLAAAMVTSGQTEVLVSVNHERAVQARAAAEAGLNHALAVSIARVRAWQANGFANSSAAITDLLVGADGNGGTLADNGSLAPRPDGSFVGGVPAPPAQVALSAATGTSYEAVVMDDDDASRGLSAADHTRVGEPAADPALDENNRFVVRAIGYGGGGTTATLEAIVGPIILPAIITNGNLTISGNPTVDGSNGSVHANGNILLSGSAIDISQNATSSGTYTTTASPNVGGLTGGGFPELPIPPVNAADHRSLADFILGDDGNTRNQAGTILCGPGATPASTCTHGWDFSAPSGQPTWSINSNTAANGTFYVEGHAVMSGSPGSAATPLEITIIAEGNISITGNPDLRPHQPELMFVTNMDLRIAGSLSQPLAFEGQMLVREQLDLAGNPDMAGQIIVENVPSVSTLVTINTISGNPSLTYNGITGANNFVVMGWREIR